MMNLSAKIMLLFITFMIANCGTAPSSVKTSMTKGSAHCITINPSSPFAAKYKELSGRLGCITSDVTVISGGLASFVTLENGALVLRARDMVVIALSEPIFKHWMELGAATSALGLPLADDALTHYGQGLSAKFDGGLVAYSFNTRKTVTQLKSDSYTNW